MKLLLVRHAQSHNNVIQASVHQRISKGELKPFEAQHEWLEQRQDDPGLTAAGHKQTAVLAKHVVRKVKTKGGGKCVILPHPHLRVPCWVSLRPDYVTTVFSAVARRTDGVSPAE